MNVVQILNTFSNEERNAFLEFCQSPFSRVRPNTLELFEVLSEAPSEVPEPNVLWARLFPHNRPYNDATFRKMRSDLYHEVCRFLSIQAYERRMEGESDFLRELYARKLWPLWRREYRRLNEHWRSSPVRGAQYYQRITQLARTGFEGAGHLPDLDSRSAFRNMEMSLDRYYLIWKMRLVVNRLVYAGIFDAGEDPATDHVFSSGILNRHLDDPLICIYYRLYHLYACGKEHLFPGLVKSLDQLDGTGPDERYEIGSHVLNYALRKANSGSYEYMKSAFRIYGILMDSGNLLLGRELTGHRFITVVRYGLALGKRKFVKRFIRDHAVNLVGKYSIHYQELARATLHFYEGRHDAALEHLPEVERKNLFLDLDVRLLRFRILYELEDDKCEDCYNSLKVKVCRLGKQKNKILAPEYLEFYRRICLSLGHLLRADPDQEPQGILVEAGDLPAELGTWVTKMVVRNKVR